MKTVFVLLLVYQSYSTHGITSQVIRSFATSARCLQVAEKLRKEEDFDKAICIEVNE